MMCGSRVWTASRSLAILNPADAQLALIRLPTGQVPADASAWYAGSVGKLPEVSSPEEGICSDGE